MMFPFARALWPRGANAPAIATVQVLNDLRPLAERLRSVLDGLAPQRAEELHREVERCGRAVVYRGDPEQARLLEAQLRAAGLCTCLNQAV